MTVGEKRIDLNGHKQTKTESQGKYLDVPFIHENKNVSIEDKNIFFETLIEFPGTSFITLQEKLPHHFDKDYALVFNYESLILWINVSKAFIEFYRELMNQDIILLKQCNVLMYLIDGGGLRLPIAKRVYNYKKDHWLPALFFPNKKNKIWEEYR